MRDQRITVTAFLISLCLRFHFIFFSYKEKKRRELAEEDDLETITSYHIADVSQMDTSGITSALNMSVDMK